MYVQLSRFERGVYQSGEPPFFSKDAIAVYEKAVAKYKASKKEVIIALRNDNHVLIRSWGNVQEQPKYGIRIKEARGSKR